MVYFSEYIYPIARGIVTGSQNLPTVNFSQIKWKIIRLLFYAWNIIIHAISNDSYMDTFVSNAFSCIAWVQKIGLMWTECQVI